MGPPMGLPMASQMGPPMAPPAAPYDGWASGYNGGHVMVGGVRPNHLMPGSYVQTNKVPAYIVCPHCRQQVLTKVKTRSSARTFVAAAAIFTVYWPLAFVPFVARPLKKKVHFCTRCGRNIGKVVTVTPAYAAAARSKAAVLLGVRGLTTAPPSRAPAAARGDAAPPGTRSDPAAAAPDADAAAGPLLRPNSTLALGQLSMAKLATAWAVYRTCSSARLVRAAPALLRLFERLRVSWLSNAVVRRTFFAWFCAGENEREIVQTMRRLKDSRIGSILDFSAEADLPEDGHAAADSDSARAQANVKADALAKEYFHGMHMASQVPHAFAAVKVTGLADPEVLFRLSMPYARVRDAFAAADHDADGRIDFTQFRDAVLPAMPGGARVASPSGLFSMVDANGDGQVDWVDVQMALGLDNPLARPLYLRSAGAAGEYGALESDIEDYERMIARTRAVIQQAAAKSVRVMVDAEHSYFQPMIDHVALVMQREFNAAASQTLVYNTYQMYRADALQRMTDDYERAAREGWRFAAKLVRGAYMELERSRAAELGYASPINPTLEATHAMYNRATEQLLGHIARAQQAGAVPPSLFVATHNNASIELVLQRIRALGIDNANEPVMFGQLLGMQDATSYALAEAGAPIYKYVPYGTLDEVMPYLIRRAQENSAVAGAIRAEASSVMAEIRRRLLGRAPAQQQQHHHQAQPRPQPQQPGAAPASESASA
ncbi:proline dehydrogenase [Coemansia javaensis]|uniref:Proline dehydrogenase n=1 Tax=Coemansia javaensis TaxID=2761396 RepID=A0A9W8HC21_9FUNG|nr:proline dehydrogenase [Coemansia javaensis]